MTRITENAQRVFLCLLCLLASFADAAAQEVNSSSSVHWAYSAYFGTGWYQVSGDRDVYVLRMTPRWDLSDADIAEDGTRTTGVELSFPITAGLDKIDLDDIAGTTDPDNLASLSVTPGVAITIPISERWALRPFASVGWGTLLNWALINSVTYVGYSPSDGPSEDFWPLVAALEFDYPIGNKQRDDESLFVSWHGMYTSFENDLDSVLQDGSTLPITDQWEFGLSFHRKKMPIKIWWFSFDSLGLAYRFSSSGDLKGISFVFRSIFER
jgi:hypothetical protein